MIICLALSKENRQALAEMNDTPIPDDLMELDDTQGVDGNSGRDWEPVVDFLDNDERSRRLCAKLSNTGVSLAILFSL